MYFKFHNFLFFFLAALVVRPKLGHLPKLEITDDTTEIAGKLNFHQLWGFDYTGIRTNSSVSVYTLERVLVDGKLAWKF